MAQRETDEEHAKRLRAETSASDLSQRVRVLELETTSQKKGARSTTVFDVDQISEWNVECSAPRQKGAEERLPHARGPALRGLERALDCAAFRTRATAGILMEMSEPKAPKTDVILPIAATEDGKGLHVLRAREDRVEAGEMRPVKDGQPITGELVRLTPREDSPALCDVEVLHRASGRPDASPNGNTNVNGDASTSSKASSNDPSNSSRNASVTKRSRPAQVATDSYREALDPDLWREGWIQVNELAHRGRQRSARWMLS